MRTRRGTQSLANGSSHPPFEADYNLFHEPGSSELALRVATVDRIIGQALDSGLNVIDTAPFIFRQRRKNEKIARALSGRQGIEDFSPVTWKYATVGFT